MSLKFTCLALISSIFIIGCNDESENKKKSLTIYQGAPAEKTSEENNKQEEIKSMKDTYKETSIPSKDGNPLFDITSIRGEFTFRFTLTDKKIMELSEIDSEDDNPKEVIIKDGEITEVEDKDAGKNIISMAFFSGDESEEQLTEWVELENIEERVKKVKIKNSRGKIIDSTAPIAFTFNVDYKDAEDLELIAKNLKTMKMVISNGIEPSLKDSIRIIDFKILCENHEDRFLNYDNMAVGCESL